MLLVLSNQRRTMRKSSNGVAHHKIITHNNIPIKNIRGIKIPGKYDLLPQIRSVQAIMFPKLHADSGFMGTPTHNFAIGDLQAPRSSAGLHKFFRKKTLPNQAHLGTRIHQYIRNHLFLSTTYSHLQVQLPFVAMWSKNISHGMQL